MFYPNNDKELDGWNPKISEYSIRDKASGLIGVLDNWISDS
jgi:hypothetical protein